MTNATAPLLALLLVLSVPAVTLAAADPGGSHADADPVALSSPGDGPALHPSLTEASETTNRLSLVEPVETSYASHGADLGSTLAGSDSALRADHAQFTLADREFDEATETERAAMLESLEADLDDRIDDLESRERTAVREHAEGERSDAELLQVLVQNYHEAIALHDVLRTLEERSDEVADYSMSSGQQREYSRVLEFHQSSIQSDLAMRSAAVDSTEPFDVTIHTSQDGYRLSTIDDSTYRLETTRFDNWGSDSSDYFASINQSAADYAADRYPWAASLTTGGEPTHQVSAGSVQDVRFDLDELYLQAYIDSGTGEIHREHQELDVDALPTAERESWTGDGLELAIEATPADGPVEVTVTDADTGDPVAATITIDGQEVGETDAEGTHLFVPPIGEYELAAETDDGSVGATIDL
ncbi:DUF7096 domain-containing protein [Natrarchaeobaculum aegyptiacum]|uniref:Uncharacterized protein n=1 Tax=Natrarchaeobaculum aegyptiacum TaxID=745377 RepID=A0A2Z2HS67_9EURY|nr:hypothetical protein [Natrarchaeobaculum aegyptiacum]ARS90031.1 hypothetical protein B1756_10030 [Natrarchaeobaculum aegyptiacum]